MRLCVAGSADQNRAAMRPFMLPVRREMDPKIVFPGDASPFPGQSNLALQGSRDLLRPLHAEPAAPHSLVADVRHRVVPAGYKL
jgi:hypothetical protein